MQPVLDHVATVVRPALRRYMAAEAVLTNALTSNDANAAETAREELMLAAYLAAVVLHHLSDVVLNEPSPALTFARIEDVRSAVGAKCVFLGENNIPVADVGLLRDVADAFKHYRLNRPSATVRVSTDIAPLSTGWGEARWGEGKWGGVEQVIITTNNGDKRALWSVLQNVFDAWMRLLGQPLPPISQY